MEQLLTNPLFQAIFNSPVARIIVMADAPTFTIIDSNNAHKVVTNLAGRDITGKSVWEIFDPGKAGGDGAVLLGNALTEAQVTNRTVLMPPFRYDMASPDGKGMVEKWWQLEIMPVGGDGSGPAYLLTTTNDITERIFRAKVKEDTERELQILVDERARELVASEGKYRGLVEQSPIAIALLLGSDLVIDAANSQMLALWERSGLPDGERGNPDQLTGRKLTDVLPDIGDMRLAALQNVFKAGVKKHFELAYPLQDSDHQKINYARIFLNPVLDPTGEVSAIIVSAIDVTEQVAARKELERAYEQVRLSKLAAQLGTFDMDLKAGTMEWDQRCRELFGISHDGAVSYDTDFLVGLHPEDRDRIQLVINRLFNRKLSNGDYDVEYRTIGQRDKKLRWVRAKGKVYFDSDDQPVRFIGSVLDITDQKHEQELRTDFIAIASHELKTPLTSLLGYIQLLERQAAKGTLKPALLEQAGKQALKMIKMINGFLNLSRLESGRLNLDLSQVSLSALIEEAVSELKLIHAHAIIDIIGCAESSVMGDKDKIGHVLTNLITNSIKYSDEGKPIQVKCFSDAHEVVVKVTDQGIGVNKKDHERLFDRYYRVEHPGVKYVSGFGVGLYLSREIVHLHGGKMWVESEPGKGSTFSFSIPRSQPPTMNGK